MNFPRIMIAAPGSGSGKTMVTCALLQLLQEEGIKAASFKCGPDYIDPMFHKEILGAAATNLDTFFTGEALTAKLFREQAAGKDISVIEGVMGLYDGLGGIREEGSSYQLAKTLAAPILLVINAHGMGRSLLALIAGFLQFDTEHLIRGVILNRIGKGFYEIIKPEIEAMLPVKVLGYMPESREINIESRHLGLKLPGETEGLKEQVRSAAKLFKNSVNTAAVLEIAETAARLETGAGSENLPEHPFKIPIGIAMDEAFCFYYEANLKLFEKMGAKLIPFSPLRDRQLPEGVQGLILGGGYPELYAKELSRNEAMKASVRAGLRKGLPSIAECGGFMYLHEQMQGQDGGNYPMIGAVPGKCSNMGKPVRFGYVEIEETNSIYLPEKETIKGHEFHYYDSSNNGNSCIARKPVSGRSWNCIHCTADRWWGFPHLYYPSNPHFTEHFIRRAAAYGTA